MKKIINKLVLFLCVILLGCSAVFATACNKEEVEELQKVVYQGTHVYTAPDTENYLVKDGKTDYRLIVPEKLSDDIKTAKEEFAHLFKMATGITIPSIPDTGLTFDENATYVSLGNTTVYEGSGLNLKTSDLRVYGLKIATKGKSVFLVGDTDTGVLNAVYTFMQITFNYECYFRDEVQIDSVTDMKLKNYDVTDVPDIPEPVIYSDNLDVKFADYDMNMYRNRMRVLPNIGETFMPVFEGDDCTGRQKSFHNTLYYVPRSVYGSHPFYSTKGDQLCYTARGDAAERELMVQLCSEKVIDCLIKYNPVDYPYKTTMTISMEDNDKICDCKWCKEIADYYGANVAPVLIFVSDMCEYVENWMNQPENAAYKRDDFTIMFFAYHNYIDCPATEVNGKYVLNNGLELHPRVSAWVAGGFSWTTDFYNKINDRGRNILKAWCDVVDVVRAWGYFFNFNTDEAFHDVFNFLSTDFYQYLAANGVTYILTEGTGAGTLSAWQSLAVYLAGKLAWNSSLDSGELIDNWFNAMYKEAAPAMRSVFEEIRLFMLEMQRGEGGANTSIMGNNIGFQRYWPQGILESWMEGMDRAVLAVEKYKEIDIKTYERIVNHISMERAMPLIFTFRFYKSYLNIDTFNKYYDELVDAYNYVKAPLIKTWITFAEGGSSK